MAVGAATNGRRIYLEVQLQDGPTRYPMGSTIPSPTELAPPKTQTLHVEVAASGVIGTIDFIRSGLTAQIAGDGRRDWEGEREIPRLAPGEYIYVRVVEADGSTAAWSSPIYAD